MKSNQHHDRAARGMCLGSWSSKDFTVHYARFTSNAATWMKILSDYEESPNIYLDCLLSGEKVEAERGGGSNELIKWEAR